MSRREVFGERSLSLKAIFNCRNQLYVFTHILIVIETNEKDSKNRYQGDTKSTAILAATCNVPA